MQPTLNAVTPQVRSAQVMGTFGGGGAQRLAYNLALGLSEQGLQSMAIALRMKGSYVRAEDKQIRLVALGMDSGNPWSLVRTFFGFRTLIRQERINVLHVHGAQSLPFVALAICILQDKPKLVFTWHDSESVLDQKGWRTRFMVWALHRCDAVSGSSRAVALRLGDRAGIKQVSVFHGGVPVCPDSVAKESASPLIVWLGRIVPPKDPQILIRAAARLRDEALQFSVCILGVPSAGTRWYMDETRALITKLGLEGVVSTPGFALDDELRRIMARAQISVQTSHTEGLSLALLECMMSGQAIVATAVGDTVTAVEDGVSGIVIPARDEQRLVDALRTVLTDGPLRKRLAMAARERAMNSFSVKMMASRAARQYLSLLC